MEKFLAWVFRSVCRIIGIDPVEYIVDEGLKEGVSQDELNNTLERLGIS